MANVQLMYRIDIGFDEDRGYAALIQDPNNEREKGVRGNSVEQLMSRLRHIIIDEENKHRHFPLESEPSRIILP